MQLRWLIKKYPKASVQEIKEYRDKTGCGIVEAKKILNRPDERVLQYRKPIIIDGIETYWSVDWEDVPVVEVDIEYHE